MRRNQELQDVPGHGQQGEIGAAAGAAGNDTPQLTEMDWEGSV